MNHRSLPFRLGAWYTLLLSATFVLVGAATFYGLQHYLRSNARDSLRRRSTEIEQILLRAPADLADGMIAQEIEARLAPEINNRFVRVARAPGKVIFLSGPPADGSFNRFAVGARAAPGAVDSAGAFATDILADQHFMIGSMRVGADSGRYIVEVGASTVPMETVLERLIDLLAVLLPLLIVCAAGGGYLLVKRALRPVDRLSQTAERMSLQNLSLRLPVVPSGDALERLSISLNNMLGRLRDSVQTSRRFLADASHELRTPLTVIKGELQELSGAFHMSSGDMRERVGSVLEEVARLEHLVSGLLVLSRLDAGETQRQQTAVDLASLALGTAEQMRLMAEDRGLEMDLSGLRKAVVRGDQGRLKQVIVNLLDNAIKFTRPGGTVTIRSAEDGTGAVLEVSDTGIGIPASAIPQVFDRFFRVEEARTREDGGAGLGLAIVKSICSMHGADIEVRSDPGNGSCFRLHFPRRLSVSDIAEVAPPSKSPSRSEMPTALAAPP